MNNKIYILLLISLLFTACSVDDELEMSEEINFKTLNIEVNKLGTVTDSVWCRFIVSSNYDLQKISIAEASEGIDKNIDPKAKFLINDGITVDSEGNISEGVKTLIVEYPFFTPLELLGSNVEVQFQFENSKGTKPYVPISYSAVSFRANGKMYIWATSPFIGLNPHAIYSNAKISSTEEDINVFYQYEGGKFFLYSAKHANCINYLSANNLSENESKCVDTKFYKLPADMDYDKIDDTLWETLNFDSAVDAIEVQKNDLIAVSSGGKLAVYKISVDWDVYMGISSKCKIIY
jgi:hypothetical protein